MLTFWLSCFLFIYRVDQSILQHMIDTNAEFIMEVTDKTKADVKVCAIS